MKKAAGLKTSDWVIYEHLLNYKKMNGYSFIFTQNSTISD